MANIITELHLEMSANWYVSKKLNSIGRVGENTVTKLIIEPTEILENVTYEIEIMSADGSKNVAELTIDGTELYLILTANMLTTSGITKMQVRGLFTDGSIKKSNIFELKVNRSISATEAYEEYAVTIFDQLVQDCRDIIEGAESYAVRAETAAVNAEAYSEAASASADTASASATTASTSAAEAEASAESIAASVAQINENTYRINDLEAIIGGYQLTDLPTGAVATITDGTALLMPSLKVGIEPVQEGSGDPSPENIRPISGWTEANVIVSPTASAEDGTTYTIQFRDGDNTLTVYGGTLDVISGLLTVTDAYIASYNAETLPSTWISDRDVYTEGATPTTGAEVVYKLANSVTYQLTPAQVRTLVGNNNIWADTGDIVEGKYYKSLT